MPSRRFGTGFGASLALHAAAILAFYPWRSAPAIKPDQPAYDIAFAAPLQEPDSDPSPALAAAASETPAPAPAEPPALEPQPPAPVAALAPPPPRPPAPRPLPPRPLRPSRQAQPNIQSAVRTTGEVAPTEPTPPPSIIALAPAAPLAAPSRPNPAWLAGVGAWLSAHRSYPETARQRGQQGSVLVHFTVERDGHVRDVAIMRGSGSDTLDQAAIALLQDARLPPFPADMALPQQSMTLPIQYRLE